MTTLNNKNKTAFSAYPHNQAIYRLDFFDILSHAASELSALAANAGICFQRLLPQITTAQNRYTKNIALDKKHAGKVCAFVDCKTTPYGQEYPFITFYTQKHGGESFVFDGYEWLKENGRIHAKPLSNAEKSALEKKRAERDAAQAKKAELAAQKQAYTLEQSIKRFNDFAKLFDSLPLVTDPANTYLQTKGFTAENLTALINSGFILKRGNDKYGGFIAFAIQNQRKTVGYQKIYDKPVAWLEGNKQNIFLPNSKIGSFAIIGKPQSTQDKISINEGFATAFTNFLTGKPSVIALDAGNLFHVAQYLSKTFKNLIIAADNDIKEIGNTGLYHALITAKAFSLDVAYPVLESGEKCDFNDVFIKYGLDEVKKQLKNKLDFSEPLNYYKMLLTFCPEQNKTALDKHFKSACFIIANNLLLNNQENIKNAALPIQEIIDNRKLNLNAESQINWFLNKKLFEIKKANGLIKFEKIALHNFKTGKLKARLKKLFNRLQKIESIKTDNDKDNYKKSVLKAKLEKTIAELKAQIEQPVIAEIKKHKKAIWLLNWQMGEGKTELMKAIADLVKAKNKQTGNIKQITYIAHRVALIKDAATRLGLKYYEEVQHWNGEIPQTLAVCANSIVNHDVANNINVLFIDEIRQTLEHILNGTVENRLEVFNHLEQAIKNADLVIAADADLNQFTLDWIKSIANKPIHLSTSDIEKNNKKIIELKNNAELFSHIRTELLTGGNVWISTDSMNKAKTLNEFLSLNSFDNENELAAELNKLFNDTGLDLKADDILLITSENKGDINQTLFLANPNQESKKYRVIIHTPVISSGVSVTNNHFNNVYAVFCNVTAPNEMLQTIARVRTANNIYCTFKTGHVKNRITNLKDLIDGDAIKRSRFANNETIELDNFDKLRYQNIIEKNKALNDFKAYFLLLAQQKGYDVLPYSEITPEKPELDNALTLISGVVKSKNISVIKNDAEIIDAKKAFKLDKANALTQQQTNALKRFKICQLVGKEYQPNDLTDADIDFIEYNKGASIIANFELLTADSNDLKQQDNDNHHFRDKLTSKTSKQAIFKAVIDDLTAIIAEQGMFNQDAAFNVCEFLQENHKEIAANGLGNYAKVSKYPIRQLTEFLEKCGYDVEKVKQDDNGVRWYSIAENATVKAYAEARAYQKSLKSTLLEDDI